MVFPHFADLIPKMNQSGIKKLSSSRTPPTNNQASKLQNNIVVGNPVSADNIKNKLWG